MIWLKTVPPPERRSIHHPNSSDEQSQHKKNDDRRPDGQPAPVGPVERTPAPNRAIRRAISTGGRVPDEVGSLLVDAIVPLL